MKATLTKKGILALVCALALTLCACGEKPVDSVGSVDYKAILLEAGFEVFNETDNPGDPDIASVLVVERNDGDDVEIVNYVQFKSAEAAAGDFSETVKDQENYMQDSTEISLGTGEVNGYQVMVAYDEGLESYEIAAQRDTDLIIFDFYQEDYDHTLEVLNKLEISNLPEMSKPAVEEPTATPMATAAQVPQHVVEFTQDLNEYFTHLCFNGPASVYVAEDDERLIIVEFSGNSGHWGELSIADDMHAQKLSLKPLLDYMQNTSGYTVSKLSLPLFDIDGNEIGIFIYELIDGNGICDITVNGDQLTESYDDSSSAASADEASSEKPTIELLAEDADLADAQDIVLEPNNPPYNLGGWKEGNKVVWEFDIETDGNYTISILYSRPYLGYDVWGTIDLYFGWDVVPDQYVFSPIATSETEDDWSNYQHQVITVGENYFNQGNYRLEMYPGKEDWTSVSDHFINLRSVTIEFESAAED